MAQLSRELNKTIAEWRQCAISFSTGADSTAARNLGLSGYSNKMYNAIFDATKDIDKNTTLNEFQIRKIFQKAGIENEAVKKFLNFIRLDDAQSPGAQLPIEQFRDLDRRRISPPYLQLLEEARNCFALKTGLIISIDRDSGANIPSPSEYRLLTIVELQVHESLFRRTKTILQPTIQCGDLKFNCRFRKKISRRAFDNVKISDAIKVLKSDAHS